MSDTPMNNTLASKEYWLRFLKRSIPSECKPDFKRSAQRYSLSGEIKLIVNENGQTKSRCLSLINVSLNGVETKGVSFVATDTMVNLEFNPDGNPFLLSGKVMHCTETVGGYKIGIELSFS